MTTSTPEFQAILGLTTGLFLGVYSRGIFMTLLTILLFEYYIFACAVLNPPGEELGDRVLINVVFLFGWVLSKFLFVRETGFECFVENCEIFYNTFPN